MSGMLSSYRRLYLTFFDLKNGRMRARFDTVEPTGAGALVAMLTRGKLTRDGSNLEFEIVTDPTKDPALRGLPGKDGAPGASAYEVARTGGYGGTQAQWLASLVGAAGKSAYQIARDGGYSGTEAQWLATLKGADGASPVLSIGTVTTLSAGSVATASLTGTQLAPKLNLGVPVGATGPAAATILGSVVLAESNLINISAGVRRRVITTSFDVPTGVPLLLLPKAPPALGYIVQAAWAVTPTKPRELTVDLTMPAITLLSSYSIDCWLLRLNA